MALLVGTNSWVTISEANDYLQHNIDAEEWFDLVAEGAKGAQSRENLLVTAYNEIQASPIISIDANSTDVNVKHAQVEMALFLLNNYDTIKSGRAAIASGLSAFTYSERSESYNVRDGGGASSLPSNVIGYLNTYIQTNTTVELQT